MVALRASGKSWPRLMGTWVFCDFFPHPHSPPCRDVLPLGQETGDTHTCSLSKRPFCPHTLLRLLPNPESWVSDPHPLPKS